MTEKDNYILKVENLRTYFPIKKGFFKRTVGYLKAVDGISFKIPKAKTFGLVGESGCGKTTAARSIIRLIPATGGKVTFEDTSVLFANEKKLSQFRKDVSIIFQDPFASLNPRMTIGNIISEPLKLQKTMSTAQLNRHTAELLEKVGLAPQYINRYPHEFSGGQRQRIGIARALVLNPKLIICDEPVSALDVSIQAQILNLLKDLQQQFQLTYLFIAHDLAVVEFFCDIIAVMYLGKIVERAPADILYKNPMHPYTRTLMKAIPKVDTNKRGQKTAVYGEVPSIFAPPKGCPFHPRCRIAGPRCKKEMPTLEKMDENEHLVACWKCDNIKTV